MMADSNGRYTSACQRGGTTPTNSRIPGERAAENDMQPKFEDMGFNVCQQSLSKDQNDSNYDVRILWPDSLPLHQFDVY